MERRDERWAYQFFPTPRPLARRLVARAQVRRSDVVLEPSAGDGRLLVEIERYKPAEVDCCELMPANITRLEALGYTPVADDFMRFHHYAHYTRIIANPPFAGDRDIRHVTRMYELVRAGGRVVSLMSARCLESGLERHLRFRRWLRERDAKVDRLPSDAFASLGIDVRAVMVELNK